MIKVLMISTDRKIFEKGTPVYERMAEYGKLFKELHIVVFSTKDSKLKIENSRFKIGDNVWVYPTNSVSKLFYVKDGIRIGLEIIFNFQFEILNSVITCQDPFETGLVGKTLSKKSGIPLHVQIHTDFYSPYFKRSILNKVRIALSKRVLPEARAIRVVSDRIKDSLSLDTQKKVSVLPIFLDVEAIRKAEITIDLRKKYSRFTKLVLVASRLTKEKDIETALSAFSFALQSRPGAGLVIVGEGPEVKNLKLKIKDLKLESAVVFEPWISHDVLISYMKTSDVFISSSLYEGYGLSMLEAHASGAVLVATNAGIAPLLVSDRLLVEPGDRLGLGKALIKALNGDISDKDYVYPYSSKEVYFKAYKEDIERALL